MARIETSGYVPTHITLTTTTAVFAGSGTLIAIIVNTTSAGTITIADGSTTVGVLKASIAEGTYTYNCSIGNGLTITAPPTTGDYTVIWTKS